MQWPQQQPQLLPLRRGSKAEELASTAAAAAAACSLLPMLQRHAYNE
jgi:hypothetical protein